jgi:hypothetical protein
MEWISDHEYELQGRQTYEHLAAEMVASKEAPAPPRNPLAVHVALYGTMDLCVQALAQDRRQRLFL